MDKVIHLGFRKLKELPVKRQDRKVWQELFDEAAVMPIGRVMATTLPNKKRAEAARNALLTECTRAGHPLHGYHFKTSVTMIPGNTGEYQLAFERLP